MRTRLRVPHSLAKGATTLAKDRGENADCGKYRTKADLHDREITCISPRAGIPLNTFIGAPLGIRLVTDAHEGESDGSLATYRLVVQDALTVLEQRINTRIFRQASVPDITPAHR